MKHLNAKLTQKYLLASPTSRIRKYDYLIPIIKELKPNASLLLTFNEGVASGIANMIRRNKLKAVVTTNYKKKEFLIIAKEPTKRQPKKK